MQKQKAFLIILDGWGIGKKDFTDAIFHAKTPFVDSLYSQYPTTKLVTYGNEVGLPEGQMGNSEVGHMNLGAGRVVWQQLALINKQFNTNEAAQKQSILNVANYCISNNKPLHLMGLVSNGGVHSSMEHLISLCDIFTQKGVQKIFIHAFTDGRDTDPKSGINFIAELENRIKNTNAKIATIIGRYYAMDRDKRWERTALAYNLLVHNQGESFTNAPAAIEKNYAENITDEFINPAVIFENNEPIAKILPNDAVLCFNFRTDRGRQISTALTQLDFADYNMQTLPLYYATMTEYDETYKNVNVLFETQHTQNTLGEVISKAGLTQLRSAETEKYPHVTFFFSGGREEPFEGESRIMEASPKVATYDLQPEMSAIPLTEKILETIKNNAPDFICLNFANTDMVGHTGVWEAIIKAAETVDNCLQKIVELAKQVGYQLIILADHGNAEEAKNQDGTPNTAHSVNLVPCIIISEKCKTISTIGKLADVAPTILKMLNLPKPQEMNGNELF